MGAPITFLLFLFVSPFRISSFNEQQFRRIERWKMFIDTNRRETNTSKDDGRLWNEGNVFVIRKSCHMESSLALVFNAAGKWICEKCFALVQLLLSLPSFNAWLLEKRCWTCRKILLLLIDMNFSIQSRILGKVNYLTSLIIPSNYFLIYALLHPSSSRTSSSRNTHENVYTNTKIQT